MQIRILLVTLMRIRIRIVPFPLMRIRNRILELPNKGSKPWKRIDADPDQAYHFDADPEPDPTFQLMRIYADPDPQHCRTM